MEERELLKPVRRDTTKSNLIYEHSESPIPSRNWYYSIHAVHRTVFVELALCAYSNIRRYKYVLYCA